MEGGATESFTVNTRAVTHWSHMVEHSWGAVAGMGSSLLYNPGYFSLPVSQLLHDNMDFLAVYLLIFGTAKDSQILSSK